MKENKEKSVTSGTEGEEERPGPRRFNPFSHLEDCRPNWEEEGISSSVDLGDLPSHQGSKKQKSGKTPLPKVPKFTPLTVDLDDSAVVLVPVQTIPSVQPGTFLLLQPKLLAGLILQRKPSVLPT